MRIGLFPLTSIGVRAGAVGQQAGLFAVTVDGEQIGQSEVRLHLRAGKDGVLELVRAIRDDKDEPKMDGGVEGRAVLEAIRKYRVIMWRAVDGGIELSCERI
jgi:hypothetical protein